MNRPLMGLVVIVGLTACCCVYGEVVVHGRTGCHIGDSDLKAVSDNTGHVVPARGKAPCPVEIFTGRKGDFYPAISIGRRRGIGHRCAIGHNRIGAVTTQATGR